MYHMKKTGKCPKCGGTDVVADAKAIDRGDNNSQFEMSVATFGKPEALIFKQKQETTVSAWVCATCGYVEFYADSPSTIKLPKA
jgi:predicted nucleic-acid-binding Zn-ribbon protein